MIMAHSMLGLIAAATTLLSEAGAVEESSASWHHRSVSLLRLPHYAAVISHMGMKRTVFTGKHVAELLSTPQQEVGSYAVLQLRGGGDIIESFFGSKIDLDPIMVASYTAAAVLAVFTVALVRKIPRSGGHAPRFVNFVHSLLPFMSPNVAAVIFHVAYLAHTLLVLYVMPSGIKEIVFSPGGVILLGTVFPIVESIRAASTDSVVDDTTWLQYWIMHGIFSYSTEFVDKIAERYPWVGKHWYAFEFYMILWLILPFTDGAAIVYELFTKPYIVPMVEPIVKRCEGWLTTVALTIVNASHFWFVSIFFMALPTVLKRFAVIVTGTAFPILATVVTVSTKVEESDTRWLTYWASFSCLYLIMHAVEKFAGYIPGLYTTTLAVTLYLMLPIFNGSEEVYRKILVPLFRQREALLLKDARTLARDMLKQLPKDRHEEVKKAAVAAFESA